MHCWTRGIEWKDEVGIMNDEFVEILSREYWFKVIEMLQQNWALIDASKTGAGCIVYFIGDRSGVFDQIELVSVTEAERQLRINGFEKFEDDEEARHFIVPPAPPFRKSSHPNGAIYSSGRYWKAK
jgi:hypothetical protein